MALNAFRLRYGHDDLVLRREPGLADLQGVCGRIGPVLQPQQRGRLERANGLSVIARKW